MKHLLIVDDDNDFRETLMKALKKQGYRTTGLSSPDALASTIAINRPDVVLLDMMFEDGVSGLDVCMQVRAWSALPIVILSVLNDETTKVKVLDAGADDYLAKPFGINELLARIRAVERRIANRDWSKSPVVNVGDLAIDLDKRVVKLAEQEVHLTRKEYALLKTLASAEGGLVTYDRILDAVWPGESHLERHKVRGLVMYLRNKLQEDLSNPRYILTEAGLGYRLNM
jgi:two-component system KDP operon response regulator KdpE